MKSTIRHIDDHGVKYDALMFVCPGCAFNGMSGLHMLPVNSKVKSPSWDWDGNLEAPTVSPSILTKWWHLSNQVVCHSFLKAGVFEYLGDCTHQYANQHVPIPNLPTWAEEMAYGN